MDISTMMSDLNLSGGIDDLIAALEQENEQAEEQIETLEAAGAAISAGPLSPTEQFLYDLSLTEVDDPGGRKRDRIANGYAICWDYLMQELETEIKAHVAVHGFSRALAAAFAKFYYSPFGRQLRGEKPRKP